MMCRGDIDCRAARCAINTGAGFQRDKSRKHGCGCWRTNTRHGIVRFGRRNTVANMNGNEPSVAHDGATSESAAELATAPMQSAALGLLLAAEIWSTNTNTSAAPRAAAPIAAAPEQPALEKVPAEKPATNKPA